MRWEQIDWHFKHWRIPDTKNGEPLTLPLVEKAIEILSDRKKQAESPWVFPQEEDAKKSYRNPQKAWARIRARATLAYWSQDEKIDLFIHEVAFSYPGYYNYNETMLLEKVMEKGRELKMDLPSNMTDIRIHDLRRTFGSYQALTGASLPVIGRSLGHKSLQATQIYARLNLDPVRAAMEKGTAAMVTGMLSL